MNNTTFLRGIGIGVAVGAAMGIAMTPRRQSMLKKSAAGKAIRAAADVMDQITDAMGL